MGTTTGSRNDTRFNLSLVVLAAHAPYACAASRTDSGSREGDVCATQADDPTQTASYALSPASENSEYLAADPSIGKAIYRLGARIEQVEAYVCVATAVADHWALTAKHCLVDGAEHFLGRVVASRSRSPNTACTIRSTWRYSIRKASSTTFCR